MLMSENAEVICAIALTLDHSFSLLDENDPRRLAVLVQAGQLWAHHVRPLEEENAQLREDLARARWSLMP
jgi:hypothetical protein